jgi:hypothetical protein
LEKSSTSSISDSSVSPRGFHRLQIGRLFGRERRVAEKIGHAENAVQRRADLVRHHGQKARLCAICRFRLIARLGQRALGETRSVTSRPTLCISLPPSARTLTSRQAIQRAPSAAAIFWSWRACRRQGE